MRDGFFSLTAGNRPAPLEYPFSDKHVGQSIVGDYHVLCRRKNHAFVPCSTRLQEGHLITINNLKIRSLSNLINYLDGPVMQLLRQQQILCIGALIPDKVGVTYLSSITYQVLYYYIYLCYRVTELSYPSYYS